MRRVPGQGGLGEPGALPGVETGWVWKPDWSGLRREWEVRNETVGAAKSSDFFVILPFYLHGSEHVLEYQLSSSSNLS